jgi:DNA-binding transcriptional regulator YiaG
MAYRETTSRKLIARRVRKARRALLLTQAEFGREFGVKAITVWQWEHGKRVPQLRHQRTLYAVEVGAANRKLEKARRA